MPASRDDPAAFTIRWLPIIVAAVALLSSFGGWFRSQGASDADITSMRDKIASLQTRVNDYAHELRGATTQLDTMKASTCQQMAKIETQFGTAETVINKNHVEELRYIALLWGKTFDEKYPDLFININIPHEIQPC